MPTLRVTHCGGRRRTRSVLLLPMALLVSLAATSLHAQVYSADDKAGEYKQRYQKYQAEHAEALKYKNMVRTATNDAEACAAFYEYIRHRYEESIAVSNLASLWSEIGGIAEAKELSGEAKSIESELAQASAKYRATCNTSQWLPY